MTSVCSIRSMSRISNIHSEILASAPSASTRRSKCLASYRCITNPRFAALLFDDLQLLGVATIFDRAVALIFPEPPTCSMAASARPSPVQKKPVVLGNLFGAFKCAPKCFARPPKEDAFGLDEVRADEMTLKSCALLC